jgi:pyruvate,water dikinase
LAKEIEFREQVLDKWTKAYWDFCIPFAHGFRLFGQVYNTVVKPANPFEFVELLRSDSLKSVERNNELRRLAGMIKSKPRLRILIKKGAKTHDHRFERCLESFVTDFESPSFGSFSYLEARRQVGKLLLEMVESEFSVRRKKSQGACEKGFLNCFSSEKRQFASDLLDLARASYRLRDDDNIYLGRVESQLVRALREAASRSDRIARLGYSERVRARQLIGQPAGAGLAVGKARVIKETTELFDFKKGEILVCDSIDPNMTFVVPLAAGIVERRGGMLIHGAIIAREYGLPCVTGVPDASNLIRTGDDLTVDGHLGIVTLASVDDM